MKAIKGKGESKKEKQTAEIISYVEAHLKDASLSELAAILGYSAIYTGNIVKKLTGKSFSELVQDIRCQKAAELLASTDISVKDIITAVGYENGSFFRNIFKEKYGLSPLQYRQKRG